MKTRCFYRTEQKDLYDRYRNPANKPLDSGGRPNRDTTPNKAFWEGYFFNSPAIGGLDASPHHDGSLEHSAFLAGWDVGEDEGKGNPGRPDIFSVQDFVREFSKLGSEVKELVESPQAAFDAYHSGASIWQKIGGRWHEVNIAKDTRNLIHQPSVGKGRYLGPLVESSLIDPRK